VGDDLSPVVNEWLTHLAVVDVGDVRGEERGREASIVRDHHQGAVEANQRLG